MGSNHRASKKQSLKSGRPPAAQKTMASISSKATQKTIVTFHQLNRDLEKAKSNGDEVQAKRIQQQIDNLGGIKAYQQASIQGQSVDRGGDSSTVLLKWMDPMRDATSKESPKLKMLEVGALSTKNACSRSGLFDVTHIDLNSQAPGIEQQDFMARPLPATADDKFDIISLSLVLNFVPEAKGRGEMLRRTTSFLQNRIFSSSEVAKVMPSLFLVLPAPCVTNSRYFDDHQLRYIMESLGYSLLHRKETAKLVYYLWHLGKIPISGKQNFAKTKIRDGRTMNNFHVVLQRPNS
ncbi:25S rRNA (adenine(2142)-N(1))-methyltransferase [Fulvia fulva]|uniref:25S rRNA adenine-N(1) methyltransferase n=1 Tax=Passalora fulva TaxID=5499 RepID=A0A9Q8UQE4_PASFU|nr:25S rRNA (adenine(2142)-N(1))-methyltransferase [Fulvia fulva]KAK4622194.1 25S rRNA (adenine(2142)-N(1))-methyltransferase [Fulvia fulva]KAK4623500.1 25S rRNA (adenine(2142)-N(1))-methyltransferase [Fulvia fulva]UJO18641.1 25S rRNA (adenine(2142)-N(1))-methyltransferase [Fulvia fulva]WPV16150.1 25S rRNA (adenine(2142)-N(1))-methyltransferase [Fulvia fulva]WPV31367.1 25S rRNA (adenine(2142)-N(1))-methyltransferase [Fulvia fulva]